MRRVAFICGLILVGQLGCGRVNQQKSVVSRNRGDGSGQTARRGPVGVVFGNDRRVGVGAGVLNLTGRSPAQTIADADPARRDQYQAYMTLAHERLDDRKFEEAQKYLLAASALVDTDAVRTALNAVRGRLNEEATAERAATDIQVVLDEGYAEDAVRLSNDALQQYAHTAAAARIGKLARQANALLAAGINDKATRFNCFRQQYLTAIEAKPPNLRVAALALQLALQNGEDAELAQRLNELQARLGQYDELCADAAQRRRDPGRLEEALAKWEAAAKIWPSPAVQLEIDDCQHALLLPRERLAVAAFEVQGDIGLPNLGALIADELLPAFKSRYDLVGRASIEKIADELKIERFADDELGRKRVARAAQVRFLVVGRITPITGLTVDARLLDVQTGLTVQTARVCVARVEELGQRLPQLAEQLLMKDDQALSFEASARSRATPVAVLKADAGIELPPAAAKGAAAPLPVIPIQPRPPGQPADFLPKQFVQLPLAPTATEDWAIPPLNAERERDFRRRCALLALELGDNLFLRGRFREALRYFEFCMTLAPENQQVRERFNRCRLTLPPISTAIQRPRLAILDFLTFGESKLLPPALGQWSAQNIAADFCPEFELVDSAELFWWMDRLGMTCAELIGDPVARTYLAQAVNAHYFLFGTVEQTSSFDVSTYVTDAPFGFLISTARIHVDNIPELRLRLGELAWLTRLTPDERLRVERDAAGWNLLLADIQLHWQRVASDRTERPDAECRAVINMCGKALRQRPDNTQVLDTLQKAEARLRQLAIEDAGRPDQEQRVELLGSWRQRQSALAHKTGEARRNAGHHPLADRQRQQSQRRAAAGILVVLSEQAVSRQNFGEARRSLEAAASLYPDDATFRGLALARSRQEESDRARAVAAKGQAVVSERDVDTTREKARIQFEERSRNRAVEEQQRRRAAAESRLREADRLRELAEQYAANHQNERAVSAALQAKLIHVTPEAERRMSELVTELARANAEKQGVAARAELEQVLAAERDINAKADAELQSNQKKYDELLAQGLAAVKQEQFDLAIERFAAARGIFRTDSVAVNLQQVRAAKAQADAKAGKPQRLDEQLTAAEEFNRRLAKAQAEFAAGQFGNAERLYRTALAFATSDSKTEVLARLAKVEQARELELIDADRRRENEAQKEAVQKMLVGAKANINNKRYDAAVMSMRYVLKLDPNNAEARSELKESLTQISERDMADADKNQEVYNRLTTAGLRALSARRYEMAIQNFRDADQFAPGDKSAMHFVEEALSAKDRAEKVLQRELQQRHAGAKKDADLAAALFTVRVTLAAGLFEAAASSAKSAAQLDPNNPQVIQALADVRHAQAADAAVNQTLQQFKTGK
jgi:Flp pilus assembly protein TadD